MPKQGRPQMRYSTISRTFHGMSNAAPPSPLLGPSREFAVQLLPDIAPPPAVDPTAPVTLTSISNIVNCQVTVQVGETPGGTEMPSPHHRHDSHMLSQPSSRYRVKLKQIIPWRILKCQCHAGGSPKGGKRLHRRSINNITNKIGRIILNPTGWTAQVWMLTIPSQQPSYSSFYKQLTCQ